ncbi:MAG: hypothetical protein IPP96_15075 [Chitinophagaceae bacterium]|nr:hypothetical protein [Chitinophagaceae bacterium]
MSEENKNTEPEQPAEDKEQFMDDGSSFMEEQADKNVPAAEQPLNDLNDPNELNANMEVHHHTHPVHGKKTWKEYFWEFLMLFLAVFCGFLAEYKLEHVIEHQREKEFAKALYSELLDDSAAVANKLARRLEKEKDMDYLSSYFKDSSLSNLPKKFYPACTISLYLINTYSFEPKDGILSQLRNSGSLRYFKSIALQKLLGDISVNINDVRTRNEQEYQYFANPIKPFMLKYYDWSWIDTLRKQDTTPVILNVINNYRQSNRNIESKILNIPSLDRVEASNMILFYKQMMVSSRTLQMNNYIITNHKILAFLRNNYSIKDE